VLKKENLSKKLNPSAKNQKHDKLNKDIKYSIQCWCPPRLGKNYYKNPVKFQTGHFENVQNQNIARKIARKHAKTATKALCSESRKHFKKYPHQQEK
jgi:hypothetical protein